MDPILVTGAAGFIGSRFVASCRKRGEPIVSVDSSSHFHTRPEHQGIDLGVPVSRNEVFDWLRERGRSVAAIVHLGACTDTTCLDTAYLDRVNLRFSQQLWQIAASRGIPFAYASSAATYGNGTLGYDDDENRLPTLQPLNPYGQSKHAFDTWALQQEAQGKAPPIWSGYKFFNVYGFGELHKGPMSSMVLQAFRQVVRTGRLRLFRSHRGDFEDGAQRRDFVAVEDVVSVLHHALDTPVLRGIYNLGTGSSRTFLELSRIAFKCCNRRWEVEFIDMPAAIRASYQYETQASVTRLRSTGFWAPFTSLETGMQQYARAILPLSSLYL